MSSSFETTRSKPSRSCWRVLVAVLLIYGLAEAVTWGLPVALAFQDDNVAEAEDADAGIADAEPLERESFLSLLVSASGIFGFVLLLISFVMVALITMNILQVRRDVLLPDSFIAEFEQRLDAKDLQGAFETARGDESFIARVLAAGLSKLPSGYDQAVEGMQEVGEDENMALEHRISYLALIGTVAPMIGLMGTVWGMIGAFEEIATSATQPKPRDLAKNIYTALFTTLEGLTVAIPAMIAYSLLRNRVARLVLEVGIISESLMSRFSNVGKPASKPGGGGEPAASPGAAKR